MSLKNWNQEQASLHLKKVGVMTGLCISLAIICYFLFPAALQIVSFVFPLLLPFLLAMVISIIVEPLINLGLKYLKLPKSLTVTIVLLGVIGGLAFIVIFASSRLIIELLRLTENLPSFAGYWQQIMDWASVFYRDLSGSEVEQIQSVMSNVGSTILQSTSVFLDKMVDWVTATPNTIMVLFVTVMATFFWCRDKGLILSVLNSLVPKPMRKNTVSAYEQFSRAVSGYVRAQFTLVSITMILSMIGLWILNIDYAFSIGVIVGLFDILPVLGPAGIYVPWLVVCLILGDYPLAIGLGILLAVVSIVRQLLEPKLIGDSLGLHPLLTLLSVFVGFKLVGIWGMIFGPILMVIIVTLLFSRGKGADA